MPNAWDLCQSMISYGENYRPEIPKNHVYDLLSPTQKQVWDETNPRNNGVVWGDFGVSNDGLNANPAEDPDLAEARKAAEAEAGKAETARKAAEAEAEAKAKEKDKPKADKK